MYNQIFKIQEQIVKALAHSRRLEIIQLLRDQELSVTDIYSMLDLPQANVSQHLMILKDAGVVVTNKVGKQVYYKLSHKNISKIVDDIRGFIIDMNKQKDIEDEFRISMQELTPITHDPVCQMRVSPKTAGFVHKHNNQIFYFCASGCLKSFKENPDKYKL